MGEEVKAVNVLDSSSEVIDGSGSGMSSEGNILTPTKRSSSSSSSGSSSNDLFQVDTVKLTNSEDEQNDVSSDSSAKSEVDNAFPSPTSSFEVCNMTHNEMVLSPTERPPVQVMDRSARYDPYRIPSSVFSTNKSSSPMEWSLASNESLFSLHLGNNSFSTEHANNFDEVGKSAESTQSGKSEESTQSGEFNMFSPPPVVMVEDTDTSEESVETEDSKTSEMGEALNVEEKVSEDHEEVKNSHSAVSPSFSHDSSHSHGSRISVQSFAFPTKKCAWPFCYCSTCSWAFCYYKLPSCYCPNCSCAFCCYKLPSCYCPNCSCAFCYCWNCSHKRRCYNSSPILTKSDRQNSAKTDVPWQQPEEKSSQVTSSSTHNGWCGCFSCSYSSCCTCGNCCHCC